MTSVGQLLHRERIGQGRELAEIAEELCVTQRYLRAIEQDDLKSLPGMFFYKSFVKQYASFLGMDAADIDRAIAAVTPEEQPVPDLTGQETVSPAVLQGIVRGLDPIVAASNRRSFGPRRLGLSFTALVAVLLGCSVFYGWWNRAPRPAANARSSPIVTAAATSPGVPVSTTVAAPLSEADTLNQDVNQVVLNLNATERTWLSITSGGKVIFSGILQPSQTKTLHGLDEAKMKVGNAGGLEVQWNGKAIGPIGPRGQVRVVKFTPENFQILGPSTTL